MSGFRATFETWLQGRAEQASVESALADEVTREPQTRAGALALIEAYRRIGRLNDAAAERLRAIAEHPELVRPAPPPPPAAPPVQTAGDRTVLRPRAAPAPPTPAAPPAPPAVEIPAAPAEPVADRTVLKPRAKPADAPPPKPEVVAPPPPVAAAPVEPVPPTPAPAEASGDRTVLKPRAKVPPAAPPPPPPPPPKVEAPPPSAATGPIVVDPATRMRPARPAAEPAAPATGRTGATGTGTGTSGTSTWGNLDAAADNGIQVGIGSVLIERYVLESIVAGGDKGGMGVVYRALDRLDEEAQDRNPYKAVKVLNEEFKRHPESIISLHREARKTMTLAHPNILTVFGFERDRRQGDTVFMVMELLEGTPLNDLIRTHKDGGLPVDEAMKIIRGVARGLAFAHEKDFVHSDVKPSNAFYTRTGQVKVLDFGIARAARISDGGGKAGEDAKTKFDAATLGAFTPPYASPEQIEGEIPEKPDDVYALGVVAYELLTGKHPFEYEADGKLKRADAKEARDRGMKPAPISKIHRTQWRTIQRALAFTRAQRPQDGTEFLDGLEIKRMPVGVIVSSAVAVLILLAAIGFLLPGFLERQKVQSITERIVVPATAVAALDDLRKANSNVRNAVTADRRNRDAILALAESQVAQVFKPDAGRYDYGAAKRIYDGVADFLADSRRFDEARDRLSKEQKTELNARGDEFDRLLSTKGGSADKDAPRIVAIRSIVQSLDPSSTLLKDARVPLRFSEWVSEALDAKADARADSLLKMGLAIAPSDPNLRDLSGRVARARDAAQLFAKVGELERRVAPLAESATALDTFRASKEALVQLRTSAPNSVGLAKATARLQAAIQGAVEAALRSSDAARAQAILSEFEELVPASFIQGEQAVVAKAIGADNARTLRVAQLRQAIDSLLAKPAPDEAWARNVQATLKQLGDLVPRDQKISDAQTRASRYLLGEAAAKRKANDLAEADRVLKVAANFGTADAELKAEEKLLKDARDQRDLANAKLVSDAKLTASKQKVLNLAGVGGGRVDEAMALYREIEKTLPAGDPWATSEAPKAIAEAYLKLAQAAVQAGQFEVGVATAQKVQPLTTLTDPRYTQAVETYRAYAALAPKIRAGALDATVAPNLKALGQRDPKLATAAATVFVGWLKERIQVLAKTPNGLADARNLRAQALVAFPQAQIPEVEAPKAAGPAPSSRTAEERCTDGSSPPCKPAPVAKCENGGTPPRCEAPAAPAPALCPDGSRPPCTAAAPVAVPAPVPAPVPPPAALPAAKVDPKACSPGFAGLGKNPKARCFDALSIGGKAPDLVVVTVGGRPLAMMRDEASNADYARYCASAGCAAPKGDPAHPVTSASAADAAKYAEWLSAQTGAHYRLPTDAEWSAVAAGSMDANGINCAFAMRGASLRNVGEGAPNDVGLRDILGNVQEWVSGDGGGWRARGGAAGDPLDECQKVPNRSHSGSPDGKTGFRLVRELK